MIFKEPGQYCQETLFFVLRGSWTLCPHISGSAYGMAVVGTSSQSKKDGKDQEAIQSSNTPDPGHHMGK